MWRTPAATASRTKLTCSRAGVRRWVPGPMRGTSTPGGGKFVIGAVAQSLVDRLGQLRADRIRAGGQQRRKERDGQALGRAAPERGARRAAPGELARRGGVPARR